jgi:hypothetical protein
MNAILMRRTPSGLSPHSAYDAEVLDGYPIGADVEVTIKQRRSNANHRHFFAALARVVQSGATPFTTTDELLGALKMSCGITEVRQSIGGAPYYVPGSISFAAKDEPAFREFKEAAFALIARHYGVDPVALLESEAA